MKNFLCITLAAALIGLGANASAQSANKKTILVNGNPTEVMVTQDGNIVSTVRDRPGYMSGYAQAPANLKRKATTTNPVIAEVEKSSDLKKGDLVVSFGNAQVALPENGASTLESVANQLTSAAKGFVLLRSKFVASSSASNVIAQKRVYACKKYLESKGIAPNKILISLEPGDVASDEVNIFIR